MTYPQWLCHRLDHNPTRPIEVYRQFYVRRCLCGVQVTLRDAQGLPVRLIDNEGAKEFKAWPS